MKLYNVTVRRPDAIAHAIVCRLKVVDPTLNGPAALTECMVWSTGTWLEVVQLDDENQLVLISRLNLLEGVQSLCAVPSEDLDRSEGLAVGLESGELRLYNWRESHCKFAPSKNLNADWATNHPRLAPTEYLAADPVGRLLIGMALESTRRLISMPSDVENEAQSTDISVPHTFCYDMAMVGAGHNNPLMACLEGYRLKAAKTLTLYELNLGLRHLLRLWSIEVPRDTNFLLDFDADRFLLSTNAQLLLIVRGELADSKTINHNGGSLIVTGAKIQPGLAVVQLDNAKMMWVKPERDKLSVGEIKLILEEEEDDDDDGNTEAADSGGEPEKTVNLSMFGKIVVLKSGFIFGVAESGDHQLLQIVNIDPLEMAVASTVPTLAPITSSLLDHRQLYTGSGQRQWSRYSRLIRGRSTESLASTELPFKPTKIFTAKRFTTDQYDGLIVLGTPSSTTVLAVGDGGSVAEIDRSLTGIVSDVGTLHYSLLVYGAVQVHSHGINYIVSPPTLEQGPSEIHTWSPNNNAEILAVASTKNQLVLSLSNQQLVYFEESPYGGKLMESQNRISLPTVASAMCFAATSDQKSRGVYVALQDQTLRHYEIPEFKQTEIMSLMYPCSSLLDTCTSTGAFSLFIGHLNGALSVRKKKEIFSRALGSSPVSLLLLPNKSVIAISSRTWLVSTNIVNDKTDLTPLSISTRIKMSQNFNTEQVQGLAAITDTSLEVLEVESDRLASRESLDELLRPDSIIVNILKIDQRQLVVSRHTLYWVECDAKLIFSSQIKCASPAYFANQQQNLLAVSTGNSISIVNCAFPTLEIVNVTDLGNSECTALASANGFLLAALGNRISFYKMGKKQLLKQHEFVVPNTNWIKHLIVSRNRVYVADSRNSVVLLSFDEKAAVPFTVICSDPIPRSVTRAKLLDPLTICIGNQYGCISILRSPDWNTSSIDSDLELIVNYRLPNEGIVSLHKGALTPLSGKNEAIIYVGIQGTVGALIPFISEAEREQLESLESSIIQSQLEGSRRCKGYTPNRNVVDGNICELYYDLENESQIEIAERLEMTIQEIYDLLESTKARIAV